MNEVTPSGSVRHERIATFTDLGKIVGDDEMLRWHDKERDTWSKREFYLQPSDSPSIWTETQDFPAPIREILTRAAEHEKKTRHVPFSRIHAKLDVRFVHGEYASKEEADRKTEVHFDGNPNDFSDSLYVYVWSSEESTTTTLFTGNLSELDMLEFNQPTNPVNDQVIRERENLIGISPLPGHLIVTTKFVPHSSPVVQLRNGRSPRVFVRLHTWIQ